MFSVSPALGRQQMPVRGPSLVVFGEGGPSHIAEGGGGQLTFSPLGPESPLRPGSPGGPCRGRWRGQAVLPPCLPPLLGSPWGRHSPWGLGGRRGLGIPGDLVHPETQPALRVSPVGDARPRAHAAPSQASPGHSPRGRGSLAGRPARASPGPPGGQWDQSSQEGLPSQLLPAGRQADSGHPGPGHGSETPGGLARALDTPRYPRAALTLHVPTEVPCPPSPSDHANYGHGGHDHHVGHCQA